MSLSLQQLLNRLSFRQMQIFDAVYQHRGYRKAAEALGLTQPAVSSQVRKLEQALGHPLFEYVGRQLYCTRAGEHVAERIEAIFDQIQSLQTDLHMLEGELSGDLRLSVVSTAQYAMPHILKDFMTLHPTVNVSLNIVNRAHVIEQLNENSDDLIVMGLVPSDRSLSSLPFLDNELVPVLRSDHPFAHKKQLTAQQFLDARLLLREQGSGNRLALEQHCQQQRLNLEAYMTLGSNDAIKHAVLANVGVAVLPKLSVLSELQQGWLVSPKIKGFPLRRSWCLVYPKGKHLSVVAQAFIDYVQSNLKEIRRYFEAMNSSKDEIPSGES